MWTYVTRMIWTSSGTRCFRSHVSFHCYIRYGLPAHLQIHTVLSAFPHFARNTWQSKWRSTAKAIWGSKSKGANGNMHKHSVWDHPNSIIYSITSWCVLVSMIAESKSLPAVALPAVHQVMQADVWVQWWKSSKQGSVASGVRQPKIPDALDCIIDFLN